MTFILEGYNWVFALMAVVSGGLLFWPHAKGGVGSGGFTVDTAEAVRLINREKGVLVDVSDPAEFAAGHAANARNVPLAQLEQPDQPQGAKGLPTNKALPILLMCPTGVRSRRAAEQLRKAGYDKAVAVSGGTAAWREASLPIEKTAPAA